MQKKSHLRKIIIAAVIIIALLLCLLFLKEKRYNLVSMLIAILSALPFIFSYENKYRASGELVVISVMSAISVFGRAIFAVIPAFKPVTAITIITGACFGKEAGFMTGAVSAVVSNIFFGQGPWTPFQMIVWGLIGYLAGIIGKTKLFENRFFLSFFGIIAGVLFSLVMDFQTLLSIEGEINMSRYFGIAFTSIPFMIAYAVSNVIFLLLLYKPFAKKLNRIKIKYGIGQRRENYGEQ